MPLSIAAYVRPSGFRNPTGVGKHQINMVRELANRSDVRLSLLVANDEMRAASGFLRDAVGHLPVITLSGNRRWLERSWSLVGMPRLGRTVQRFDWVYAPMEVAIPRRGPRLACTVHCVNWFERSLPWYEEAAVRQTRWRLRPMFRRIARQADLIVTVSEFLKGRLCELFNVDAQRVCVVGNGVEAAFLDGRLSGTAIATAPAGRPYLLVVSALESRKGAEYLLSFASRCRIARPEVRIVVAGGALGHQPFVDAARRLENMELLTYVGGEALVRLVRGATALLLLSRFETFGIPAVEAMAVGTPVIAASFGALPEVVGEAGLIVSPGDSFAVLRAVQRLLEEPNLRSRLASAGWQRVKRFTWEACADRLVAALRRGGDARTEEA